VIRGIPGVCGCARGRAHAPRSLLLALTGTLVFASAACGAGPRPSARGPGAAPSAGGAPSASASAPATASPGKPRDAVASLDELAQRGPSDAPLMRVAMRVAQAAPRAELAPADHDACFRAALAAGAPVRTWFEDSSGARRGDVANGASVVVPPRGPACAKKGETLSLVVDGAAADAVVRAVIFTSP
jgi:hypothetical protein